MKITKWTRSKAPSINVASVATATSKVVQANPNRISLLIQNTGTEPVLIRLGGDVSTSNYHFVLSEDSGTRAGAGGTILIDQYIGSIHAIVENNTSVLAITEL